MGFTKLDDGFLDSSLVAEGPIPTAVFVCLLSKCGADGIARISKVVIEKRLGLTFDEAEKAFDILQSADKNSRSTEFEGRRIERVDGGWLILNYLKYRGIEYSDYQRDRMAKYREKTKIVAHSSAPVALRYASASASAEFQAFWSNYPRRVGKGAAEKAWIVHVVRAKVGLPVILSAIEWQKKSDQWTKDGGQFIPHPATWLNQHRWEDDQKTERKCGVTWQ
jgi:hypothetical protein